MKEINQREVEEVIKNLELSRIPDEYRMWSSLNSYRERWDFLPYSLRNRIAEQLIACDYLMSMELWLKPVLTIKQRQRVLYIQLLAAIYDGILNVIIEKLINEKCSQDLVFKKIYNKRGFYGERRTMKPVLDLALKFSIVKSKNYEYLDRLRKVRNWVHISNVERFDFKKWVLDNDFKYHKDALINFRKYIKKYF